MNYLYKKQIVVGITGGIAAYKAAELVRILRKSGAAVRVVMTSSAQKFITPLSLQGLSGQPVHTELLDEEVECAMGHIALARWADLIVIAPASANCIARLRLGIADDLLTTLCLASAAPLCLAPAMNQQMWYAAPTQENIIKLQARKVHIWGPDSGAQACGEKGPGRMLEPQALADLCAQQFVPSLLAHRHLVITAGPTREALDPVRYLGNFSSGKMGFALARAAQEAGARVTLVAGPVSLEAPWGVERVDVVSALDMHRAVMDLASSMDIFIGAAAVSDFRPAVVSKEKIKKTQDKEPITLSLIRNPDIISTLTQGSSTPFCVGFAAESTNLLFHAREKLRAKKLDLILANDIADPTIGFESDDNAITLICAEEMVTLPKASKEVLARELITRIARIFLSKRQYET